jgi:hypothetical protein
MYEAGIILDWGGKVNWYPEPPLGQEKVYPIEGNGLPWHMPPNSYDPLVRLCLSGFGPLKKALWLASPAADSFGLAARRGALILPKTSTTFPVRKASYFPESEATY